LYLRSIILILIIATILIGCNNSLEIKEDLVESRINSFILNEDQNEIDINALTDFTWEKAYIFTPYTTADYMKERLGFNWKNSVGIDYRDDINLIVFVKDKKVVKYMKLPRKYGDFNFDDIENEITPENSIMTLKILD
jgi:hypothetical protein